MRISILSTIYLATIIVTLISCNLSKPLAKAVTFDNWTMDFIRYCGNTANRKPFQIIVQARSGNKASLKRTYYWFYEETESVHKGEALRNSRRNNQVYLLIYTDSTNLKFEYADALALQNPKWTLGQPVSISTLDSFVFNKLIELSDSAHLKNFRYLLKAQGFRLVSRSGTNVTP